MIITFVTYPKLKNDIKLPNHFKEIRIILKWCNGKVYVIYLKLIRIEFKILFYKIIDSPNKSCK